MIIGNGMLGSALREKNVQFSGDYVFFASGVSNSGEFRPEEYQRELSLLSKLINSDHYIVYFGSCSIFDESLKSSTYVNHKLHIERLLQSRGRALVIRLPQVVGQGGNKHNLINFLIDRITKGIRFDLWSGASRSLIDVHDATYFIEGCLNHFYPHFDIVNIAAPTSISTMAIVDFIERCTGKKANFNLLEKGSGYVINTDKVASIFPEYEIKFPSDYFSRLISKHVHLFLNNPI